MTSTEASPRPSQIDISQLGERLEHSFRQPELLKRALTHPSAVKSRSAQGGVNLHYERLEFLGDRVLGLIVADLLLVRFPKEAEGAIAKRHAALVSGETVAEVAEKVGLADFLIMARGEDEAGQRHNPTLLANSCEAVIAALYLDAGLEVARRFVATHWTPLVEADIEPPRDPKTSLQEWAQGRGLALPSYREVQREGPAHDPVFTIEVQVKGAPVASGVGRSKRQAEQMAAQKLLSRLEG
jgi:ribonuclease-3